MMKSKVFILCFTILLIFGQIVFGQDDRGVKVSVKQAGGRKQDEALYRNSYALLIGNSVYSEWGSLPGVGRDIPQIEAVLRDKHGFLVEKALNLSKDELVRRIDQFISDYGQDYNNRLLIYYAGHGYTAVLPGNRVMGYLVMKDAPIVPPVEQALLKTPSNMGAFRLNAVSMDDIENLAKAVTTRHALFVFDSCFSGTALYRDNSIEIPQEISSEELEQMRGFLTAGNEKQRVRDDSPFRRAFIKGLEGKADINGDGYILSSELGAYVKREVYMETRNTDTPQSPIFGKQIGFTRGDMIFVNPYKDSNEMIIATVKPNNSDLSSQQSKLSPSPIVPNNQIVSKQKTSSELMNSSNESTVNPISNLLSNKDTLQNLLKFYEVEEFSDGLARTRSNNKYGFIDRTGREIVDTKYDDAYSFSDGIASVRSNGKYGGIDQSGKLVIPYNFNAIWEFSDGVAWAFNGKWGLLDKDGNVVIDFGKYNFVENFSEGVAVVNFNNKFGFIDKAGDTKIPFKYESVNSFSEGLAGAQLNGLWGFIDKTGREVISFKYDWVKPFSEGLAWARLKDGKCGVIDQMGRVVIPFRYDGYYDYDVYSFSNGLAVAKLNDKYGLIDRTGNEVIKFGKYDLIYSFSNGIAQVFSDRTIGFIDKTGREVIPIKYDKVWCEAFRKKGFIGVTLNGKKGFVDIYGNEYFDF